MQQLGSKSCKEQVAKCPGSALLQLPLKFSQFLLTSLSTWKSASTKELMTSFCKLPLLTSSDIKQVFPLASTFNSVLPVSFDFDYLNFSSLQGEKYGSILLTNSHLLLFKRLRCQEFYETLLSNDSGSESMYFVLAVKGTLCCPVSLVFLR